MHARNGGVFALIYTENNVFDEALNRIRMLFDTHEDVIVSMSGGKDSTVVLELALIVARKKNRLPVKAFWLDQEAEWQHTVDYMDSVFRRPEVEPYWFQIPFDFTNSLSAQSNFLKVYDESCPEKWIHQKSDISIKENPLPKLNRYHPLVKHLPTAITSKNCAVLVGMRMTESPRRRMSITNTSAQWHGITWCSKNIGNTRKFWPIYDFTDDDVWTAIARNGWKYNQVYDLMYRWGFPKKKMMRVSTLIHETSWHAIELLQEFEPKTYNRFCARVAGVSTFNHCFDSGTDIVPKELPFAFRDWKEYRDYLLIHITKPEYWDLFRNRWEGQDGEQWYKIHVKEVILNDIDGTVNQNNAYTVMSKERLNGKYAERRNAQFRAYMDAKEGDEDD